MFLVLALLTACGGRQSEPTTPPTMAGHANAEVGAQIDRGLALVREGRCEDAIREGFAPAVAAMEGIFPAPRHADRAREASQEVLQSLVNDNGMVVSSDLTPTIYSDALYMIAFCQIELEDLVAAERTLARALEVIPDDVMYLSELGHIYQARHDFQKALENYERAVASVERLRAQPGAASLRILGSDLVSWHGRALRGVGFSLIELDRLDEAEATYRRALAINPNDEQSQTELAFIAERRAQR
jgi:tetratricopeptide (TPR) repeat protein